MAIAIQELIKVNPENVRVGTIMQVKIEFPGEVKDEKTGEKKPGKVIDEFKTEVTGVAEDKETGKKVFVLSDRVHNFMVPEESLARGRFGVMNLEMISVGEAKAPNISSSLQDVREKLGLPRRLPRGIGRR